MAYPNPIKILGPLSQTNDMFEYFKGALLDSVNEPDGKNLELWPYFYDPSLVDESFIYSQSFPLPNLPFNRQVFYNWIDYWTFDDGIEGVINEFKTINGVKLYTFADPQSGWTIKAINDWGKIKTLELALFGNVANGGNLSSSSIIGSGYFAGRIPYMSICSMNYLRYALVRFEDYGICHSLENSNPPPTDPISNGITRRFDWTNAPGFNNISQYEYNINGEGWVPVGSKPIIIPFGEYVGPGNLLLRTKSHGYFSASTTITNDTLFDAPVDIYLWVEVPNSSTYVVYVGSLNFPVYGSLTFTGNVMLSVTGGGTQNYPFNVSLNADQDYSTYTGFGSNLNTSAMHFVITPVTVYPSTINGRTINLYLNEQIPI